MFFYINYLPDQHQIINWDQGIYILATQVTQAKRHCTGLMKKDS